MNDLKKKYSERYHHALEPITSLLRDMIADFFEGVPHIDRIDVRPKSIESFLVKSMTKEHDKDKYRDPYNQIQDQLGARIVCFFLDDVEPIAKQITRYFTPIEIADIIPDNESEFGYVGKHFILLLPTDFNDKIPNAAILPTFFELQIKTLYQHAWAQANHDIAYKPMQGLSVDNKRRVAFTAAQSWGADMIFNELQRELR